jgi:hypothetical protein
MKKLVLVLVLVFALAIPALANPFVDVPLNHWAYDAVQTLAAKGVIVGYPDGTFGGQRTLTRYEMAEALAKALAYVEQYGGIKEDVEILSKLAVEFADELANLGVKVADLEATLGEHSEAIAAMEEVVDRHERFFDPVTISGVWSADYSKDVMPVATATLTDEAEITFSAEVNPETTVALTMDVTDVLSGAPAVTFSGYDLSYNGDWSLWISDEIAPATIGLGLIYDFGTIEEFPGVWAQWNWDTDDEDLGTWTMFMDVEDFYILNVAFNIGDDDDIPVGVTASYDQLAMGYVGGLDVAFDLTDEDDEDQVGLALEGGVFSDLADTSFAVAGQLSATFGDDDDIDATLDAWYVDDGFVPTNTGYDPNELGVKASVVFPLTDAEDDEMQIAANPYWSYVMDTAMAPVDHYVGLQLDFTNIDEDHEDSVAYVSAEYDLLTTDITLAGEYLNLYLGDEDELSEFTFNVHGEYTIAAVPDYVAMANFLYSFEDDPMVLVVEGRLVDTAPMYSAEAQLQYAVAENTDLKLGVEMNDWEADINDWSDSDDWVINDNVTKVYAGIEVSF